MLCLALVLVETVTLSNSAHPRLTPLTSIYDYSRFVVEVMSSQEALSGSRCSSLSSSHGSRLASSTDLSRVDAPDLIADKQLPLDQHHCKNLIITNDANDAKTKIKQNMIDLLWAENSALKTELDIYHKKISRMKQVSAMLLCHSSSAIQFLGRILIWENVD